VLLGLRNRLLARADALVSMSSDLTAEFRDGGVPAERIHLIPQTVEIARFRPAAPADRPALRKKLGLPEQGLIVVFTGRLVSYKGLPALLDAWKGLAPRHPGATLVLVGAGGVDVYNCEEALRRFVREHGLEDRVIFTGSRTNVEEYLQASDILAFPTENEAFGISLIEGMACGLPSVSTTVGGVKDILAHDVNGLVVEPGNSGQLGAALDRLLRDPDLRARLGRAAARTVRERYTREIVSVQYLELFRRLAAAGGKGNG
jgi:glycosyltransferase involved in cell wall biosynthesis